MSQLKILNRSSGGIFVFIEARRLELLCIAMASMFIHRYYTQPSRMGHNGMIESGKNESSFVRKNNLRLRNCRALLTRTFFMA